MKLKLAKNPEAWLFKTTNEDGASVQLEASPKFGGNGSHLRPMENLLASLASCASIDTLAILQKQKIEVEDYQVLIEARRNSEVPGNFEYIKLGFRAKETFEIEKFVRAVDLSMSKYCSVALSLDKDIQTEFDVQFIHE